MIDATYRGTVPIGVKFKFKYTQAYGDTGPVVVTESWPTPDGTEIFPGELTTNTINISEQQWVNRMVGATRLGGTPLDLRWDKEGNNCKIMPNGTDTVVKCLDCEWTLEGYVWAPAVSPSVFIQKWGDMMTGEIEGLTGKGQKIYTTNLGEDACNPKKIIGFPYQGESNNTNWVTEWLRLLFPQWISKLGGPQ